MNMILLSSNPFETIIQIAWLVAIVLSILLIVWIATTAKNTKEINRKLDQILKKMDEGKKDNKEK